MLYAFRGVTAGPSTLIGAGHAVDALGGLVIARTPLGRRVAVQAVGTDGTWAEAVLELRRSVTDRGPWHAHATPVQINSTAGTHLRTIDEADAGYLAVFLATPNTAGLIVDILIDVADEQ